MKIKNFLLSVLSLLFILFMTISMSEQKKTYTAEWKQVDSLLNLQQPQSAQKIIDRIYQEALAQDNAPQIIKAHLYRSNSLRKWSEDGFEQAVAETEEAIAKSHSPVKNILHSIAADIYWRYYEQNRWAFYNRTVTDVPSDDIRTWSITQLVEKCEEHYAASLAEPRKLQNVPIESFYEVVEKKSGSTSYRPTLFDLLSFRAIEFYGNHEANYTQPKELFTVSDFQYFAPTSDFIHLSITTADTLSFKYRALTILQQVLAFHQHDPDPVALMDADLQRLDFVYQHCTLLQKEDLYVGALDALYKRFTSHPAASELLFRMAKAYNRQGKAKEGMDIIEKTIARFPHSFGAKNCMALKDEITQPDVQLTADDATLPNKPFLISVTHKNIPILYYKVIPVNFKQAVEWRYDSNSSQIDACNKIKPIAAGQWVLPDQGDYQKHTIEMALTGLKEGYYVLMASTAPDFSSESYVIEKPVWVTNLGYLRQELPDNASIIVLHRQTGKPLKGIKVQEYYSDYNYAKRKYETTYGTTHRTDANGMVQIRPQHNNHSIKLFLSNGTDQYAGDESFYLHQNDSPEKPFISTTFFTDRAIYRPGQTVWFKGVVLEWNHGEAKVVEKRKQTVVFFNTNHEKVSEIEVVSNEFGSFSGRFTIPATGLTGQMRLQGERGSVYFRVEEYKRPKFEVSFEPVQEATRLGKEVAVTGKAATYAGSAVSEANVTYRVVRQALYPLWRWWWGPVPPSTVQEVAAGTTITREDGSFAISFTAIPDPTIAQKEAPVFQYTVYASVSDLNGETHETTTTLSVGYQSLLVSTDLPEAVNGNEKRAVHITATHLNGQAQAATGTLTIWKLRDPGRVVEGRRWQGPDQFSMTREKFLQMFPNSVYDHEDNLDKWEKEKQVCRITFDTKTSRAYPLPDLQKWSAGKYVAEINAVDAFGEAVENSAIFTLFSAAQNQIPASEPIWFHVVNPVAQPGETVQILVGSAYPQVEAYLEVGGKDHESSRRTLFLSNEQSTIDIPVTENERGNFAVQLFFVKNNRSYSAGEVIQVPYENKKLHIEFATFRDKLQPGEEEEWRITIKDKSGDAVAAELLASMYDSSLDAFAAHTWRFFPWSNNDAPLTWRTDAAFGCRQSAQLAWHYPRAPYTSREYDNLINPIGYPENRVLSAASPSVTGAGAARSRAVANEMHFLAESLSASDVAEEERSPLPTEQASAAPQIRTNFNETAFFYPHLRTNEKGETVITFTLPQALTRWKMQGLAWTRDLKVGMVAKELVTQKELMIFTNPPRFFRENDTMWFSAKLSNVSDQSLNIRTEIQFFDALTMQPLTQRLLLENSVKTVQVAAGGNQAISWKIHIPEGLQAITYRITAVGNRFSDGEESAIPVLTNRMLVTESFPLPVRGHQTKSFAFTKLLTNKSRTLTNHAYTLEFTSNPAWSAIQALPYMMEYPYECAEQAFSRYYANAIATHIANSDPQIKQIFERWRTSQPDALLSNLEKNQELKTLLLEETPWVCAAKNESERKQRIAILFDLNKMNSEMASALRKVEQAQTSNGGFAWFKGGRDDRYITQHIVAGIGHLQKTGIPTKASDKMVQKALSYMDARIAEDFAELKTQAQKDNRDLTKENHLGYLAIHYLYARSFFVKAYPVSQNAKDAFDYYQSQAVLYWTQHNNYLKGMLALSLHRFGHQTAPQLIMKSLTETALHSDEMGMYWKNSANGWWWYQAPVETQALMIEAYHELLNDRQSVEELKIGLLKQKQTQEWKTTKATAEAVYALLLTGDNLLASNALCQITVGNQPIDPNKLEEGNRPEAGTGYFKMSWKGEEVKPGMGKIGVTNPNPTIAWGAAYWQYFEQLDKITPAQTGVRIQKQLFVKTNTPNGPVLTKITQNNPVKVGDKVTVRLEIRADRDMEYVHLKDMRAAAFEPVNVLSGYKWQGGLGYYESTRDAATNFFISYLPKGTYIFEYELFATQQGEFSNGVTTLQCMYAPEFSTHSEGIRVKVLP